MYTSSDDTPASLHDDILSSIFQSTLADLDGCTEEIPDGVNANENCTASEHSRTKYSSDDDT